MEIRRFFAGPECMQAGQVVLRGAEFMHCTRVLRHRVGFQIIVCTGDGLDHYAVIRAIEKDHLVAEIERSVKNEAEPKTAVNLFVAMPKGDKLDWVIQKCVELGVRSITPFVSEHCENQKFNHARANRIALEACKQCGRAVVVPVLDLIGYDEMLVQAGSCALALMAYEKEQEHALPSEKIREARSVALIVGAEGGFSAQEAEIARGAGVRMVGLGKRILRAETAAVVATALVLYLAGALS